MCTVVFEMPCTCVLDWRFLESRGKGSVNGLVWWGFVEVCCWLGVLGFFVGFLFGWGFFSLNVKWEVSVLELGISSAGQCKGLSFNMCQKGSSLQETPSDTRNTLSLGHFFQFSRRDVPWWARTFLPGNSLYFGCAKGRRWWDGTLCVNPKPNEDTGTVLSTFVSQFQTR